jgi:acyl-CoA dehydrogenase
MTTTESARTRVPEPVETDRPFRESIHAIAETVAGPHADAVDQDARFPVEAITAMREAGVLCAYVPSELGGAGASLEDVAEGCYALGRQCAATGMIYAMHNIQLAMIIRHLDGSPWFTRYLGRVAAEQRLIASITSEVTTGGDMSRSHAPLRPREDGRFGFSKEAHTISYGEEADDYLTTLRRSEDAAETDQVFVLHLGEDTDLVRTGGWNTLGMRGTSSPPFSVEAHVDAAQAIADPVSVITAESLPVAYVLWSHVWLGIATAAFERAHRFVRAAARRQPGEPLAVAERLARLSSELNVFRALTRTGLADFVAAERASMHLMPTVLRFNNLKISAAEYVSRICLESLGLIGVAGYRNDSPYSVGRQVRDSLSAQLMVNNDRIHSADAMLLRVTKGV